MGPGFRKGAGRLGQEPGRTTEPWVRGGESHISLLVPGCLPAPSTATPPSRALPAHHPLGSQSLVAFSVCMHPPETLPGPTVSSGRVGASSGSVPSFRRRTAQRQACRTPGRCSSEHQSQKPCEGGGISFYSWGHTQELRGGERLQVWAALCPLLPIQALDYHWGTPPLSGWSRWDMRKASIPPPPRKTDSHILSSRGRH